MSPGTAYNEAIGKLWDSVVPDETYQKLQKCGQAHDQLARIWLNDTHNARAATPHAIALSNLRTIRACLDTILAFETQEIRELYEEFTLACQFLEPALMLLVEGER